MGEGEMARPGYPSSVGGEAAGGRPAAGSWLEAARADQTAGGGMVSPTVSAVEPPSSTANARANGDAPPPGYRLMLKEMAPDERPRERLKLRGPQSLSDGDLLAIILNTGVYGSRRPIPSRPRPRPA